MEGTEMMNISRNISIAVALLCAIACVPTPEVEFAGGGECR